MPPPGASMAPSVGAAAAEPIIASFVACVLDGPEVEQACQALEAKCASLERLVAHAKCGSLTHLMLAYSHDEVRGQHRTEAGLLGCLREQP